MRILTIALLSFFTIITHAMTPVVPPPPAANPAAVHTMHHSANANPAHSDPAPAPLGQNNTAKTQGLGTATQYYENSVRGLRDYLDSIEYQHPQVYAQLDKQVLKLEDQQFKANVVGYGSIAVSAIMTIGAFTFMQSEYTTTVSRLVENGKDEYGLPNYEWQDEKETTKMPNIGLIGTASLVYLGGVLTAGYMAPEQNDIRRVINNHNRLLPEEPLRLGMTIDPSSGNPGLTLAYNF